MQQIISAQQQQQLQQQQDQIQQHQQNLQQQIEEKGNQMVQQAQAAAQFPTEVISFPLPDPDISQLIQKPIEYLTSSIPVSNVARDSMFPMSRTIPRRRRPQVSFTIRRLRPMS